MGERERLPIAASFAIAEAFTRQWWDAWGLAPPGDIQRARYRTIVALPDAQKLLAVLLALPNADRMALASALRARAAKDTPDAPR